jgi:hypothetical protein
MTTFSSQGVSIALCACVGATKNVIDHCRVNTPFILGASVAGYDGETTHVPYVG